ncbi:MAG: Asp-tRNA(Asn)/Glu-tRNA(Gln) amidotransferase GatCAB subunit B, partial [Pseudomonadota bacterium]
MKSQSKCFSPGSTEFGQGHNQCVTSICAGMPGTLPSLNREAVDLAIKTGLVLNCEIQKHSVFSRKQYFYPDMPKGYQVTQFHYPIAQGGYVEFYLDGEKKKVTLERAHMEEDAGKSTHHGEYTLINLNRAGTPLLEIVS